MLSIDEIKPIIPDMNWSKAESYIPYLNTVLPEFEINTPFRKAHFLAQLAHESGGLKYVEENLNYSAQGLRSIFGKYFPTMEMAEQYARKPEKIANKVYANRMGNGDEQSGDGWKYRGRGLIQLTGKSNYQRFGQEYSLDSENNPDLLLDPEVALISACWYWKRNKLNNYADADDIHMVTKRINGGTNGILHRQQYLESFKKVFEMLEKTNA